MGKSAFNTNDLAFFYNRYGKFSQDNRRFDIVRIVERDPRKHKYGHYNIEHLYKGSSWNGNEWIAKWTAKPNHNKKGEVIGNTMIKEIDYGHYDRIDKTPYKEFAIHHKHMTKVERDNAFVAKYEKFLELENK